MIIAISIFMSFLIFLTFSFFIPNNSKSNITISLLKISAGGGVIAGGYWTSLDCPSFIFSSYWFFPYLQNFSLSFVIDYYFIIFGSVALLVTWSIIEFSHYYMVSDPHKQAFFNTLILFLFFMLLLVASNSLFLLFIGWEGVGILSFILIGWWFTRSDANSAALQAIIYNRIGDSGMILFLLLCILQNNTWNLNEIIYFSSSNPLSQWGLLGIIIAAIGKSAQFSLHPWLPSAMEGPTPVSALLHSSTMVVAGVFLLVRCTPILENSLWALPTISIIGALTALFAASAALSQYDIKKIVAYSTTSQLGLMVVSIGLNLPWLALFHICTHAFFKALLFLCSGSIIHSLNNEQDLRKMGSSGLILPVTSSTLTVASLALCGVPFLAGYYSKDLILEAGQYSISNNISIILALIATLMTAAYSSRIVYFLAFNKNTSDPASPISEENKNLTFPLLRLLIGVFIVGWSFAFTTFHSSSLTIPLINKSIPLIISILAAFYLFFFSNSFSINLLNLSHFLSNNWFFVHLFHSNILFASLNISIQGVLRSLDQGWATLTGPGGAINPILYSAKILQKSQNGNLLSYTFYFILLVFILLIFLIAS
uniref:NADH-ubiquinone oxidoreductase chain 5 n=1 Tax=Amphipholis squamata TaxID=48271 RepID=D3H5W0_AMPSQ|nr:NADH dehydrogenase subunit 5 [Amphipholis squamata]